MVVDINIIDRYSGLDCGNLKSMYRFSNILKEAYKNINADTVIEKLLIDISNALQPYKDCLENVKNLNTDDVTIQVQSGAYIFGGFYNPINQHITLIVNEKCLKHIYEFKNIPEIKRQFKKVFTHENTHYQQDIHSDRKVFKVIKQYPIDKEHIVQYANTQIEVDAYARQIGCHLKDLYLKETIDQLFKRLFKQTIEDEDLRQDIELLFNLLTPRNQRRFLKTLYEYLEAEELNEM